MLVIHAAVDIKYTAQSFQIMLETQLVDGIQSLSECGVNMAIAFFKMRFSSSSLALRC